MGAVTVVLSEKSRLYLTIECLYTPVKGRQQLALLVSIPSREEPEARAWPLTGYLPTEAQVTDMSAYISNLVTNATLMFVGAQRELPLD